MSIDLGFALHPKWVEQTGVKPFLAPLQAAGMSVLEFTLFPDRDEWQAMQALVEECVHAGYRCHFHAPYNDLFNPEGFVTSRRAELEARFIPALEFAEQMAQIGHHTPALVIHGAHGQTALEQLTEDTLQFLVWVLERTTSSHLMLEILPPKPGYVRVGETFEQILQILGALNRPRLSACWDFGHSVLQGYKGLPPVDYMRAVRHVHIHDLNAERQDHFPLIYGHVPWQANLRALMGVGFQGAVVMEINGFRASKIENLPARLAESFAAMREVIQ